MVLDFQGNQMAVSIGCQIFTKRKWLLKSRVISIHISNLPGPFFLSTVAGFKGEADEITVAASCFSWCLALEFQLGFSFVIFQEQGIDTNDYPPGAVSELCDELYEDGGRKEPVNAGCVGMRVFLSCRCLSANVFFKKKQVFLADVIVQLLGPMVVFLFVHFHSYVQKIPISTNIGFKWVAKNHQLE